MIHYLGLGVSQIMAAICIVDDPGRRLWGGQCVTRSEQIGCAVTRHRLINGRHDKPMAVFGSTCSE